MYDANAVGAGVPVLVCTLVHAFHQCLSSEVGRYRGLSRGDDLFRTSTVLARYGACSIRIVSEASIENKLFSFSFFFARESH